MPKNNIFIAKINSITSKFDKNEQKILHNFLIEESLDNLFNEKPISKNKINLFFLLKSFSESVYENKKEILMRHKAIQTRALILDLINTDYSIDIKYIYKPEKWIFAIIKDINDCLIDYPDLINLYNKSLIQEFRDIFLNKVEKYGSNGNQLLVNFLYYIKFIKNYVDCDFTIFLNEIKKQINPSKLYKDIELNNIVDESFD
ncbi:hypothetical protein NCER_100391 [Vairimorpha ceranae BRL01]|uniref:Uncharacterized protein n=2 Tax=Vairimorpha ceranae TaxID=40302 RepID=C4V7G2_VAIC1|nr:hypothetical protein AAJ76_560007821 [Vairimorpha ceranae]EEQ82851.1 hypothetical protein NCER_100391 [Vairimorpha ceranae BRL01]KAF5140497.1 hypothetical protein G9O61_00g013020 [Vairimorpha ceranae]KKO74603.1 hypothetical protein AAJ76_560007821 [Vairimorpha ceranae]